MLPSFLVILANRIDWLESLIFGVVHQNWSSCVLHGMLPAFAHVSSQCSSHGWNSEKIAVVGKGALRR